MKALFLDTKQKTGRTLSPQKKVKCIPCIIYRVLNGARTVPNLAQLWDIVTNTLVYFRSELQSVVLKCQEFMYAMFKTMKYRLMVNANVHVTMVLFYVLTYFL